MREFGFDAAGTVIDAEQRFENQQHVLRIVAPTTAPAQVRGWDQLGELIDSAIRQDGFDAFERGDTR